jgi:peptidase M48-like protein
VSSVEDGASARGEPTAYFDGMSNRRRVVDLGFADALEIGEEGAAPVRWAYSDIRRADSPVGMLRVSCLSAPPLARLEIRAGRLAAELASRCARLDENRVGGGAVARIVGWSVAASVSIVLLVWFALPFAADHLAPLVPKAFEQRMGDASEVQIKAIFGDNACDRAAGQAAYGRLLKQLREAAGLDTDVQSIVLATDTPNAFALPGGKVYLFSGLLTKAENPDEIAGVLAHELGHLKHRDNMRGMIYDGAPRS